MRCTSPDTHHTPVARCGYVRAAPPSPLAPRLAAVRDFAAAYDERPLSLYSGNCRVFCARVRREVSLPTPGRHTHSLTHPGGTGPAARSRGSTTLTSRRPARQAAEAAADARLALSLLHAGALPALYPAVALALCWEGLLGGGGS